MPAGRTPLSVQRTVLRAAPRTGVCGDGPVLPTPARLVAAADDRIRELNAVWQSNGQDRFAAAATDTVNRCWAAVLAGLLADHAAPFALGDLVTAGLLPQHRRLLKVRLPLLQRQGPVRHLPDGRWQLVSVLPPSVEPLRALLMDHPATSAEAGLVTRQLQHLSGLLRGTAEPVHLLSSDTARYQHFYDLAPRNRFTHLLVRTVLEEIVRRWPEDRPLRVLEVGAGTGGLTAAVLPVLPAERTRYTFTDISVTFLTPAEHRFADYNFVDHRTFDLDADPAGQGLPEGGFVVVLAANALHTATELKAALHHVRQLLAPGGRLLAGESHDTAQLAAFFGALDSFWRRSDHALRPVGLLLDHDQWPPLLEQCGFTGVVRAGTDAGCGRNEFSVFVAAADDRAAPLPALAAPASGTAWTIAVESPDEEPLARCPAELLGGAAVTIFDQLSGPAAPGAQETVTVLLFGEPEEEPQEIVVRTTRRAAALRALTVAHDRLPDGARSRAWLVTRPTGLLPAPERPTHPGDAPVWGIARTLVNEWLDLAVHRVSLDRCEDPATDALRLARELLDPCEEDEIVLTRSGRFVPRETEHPAHEPSATATAPSFALAVHDPGLSYRLAWTARPVPAPGPGQIVIAVKAAALKTAATPSRPTACCPPRSSRAPPPNTDWVWSAPASSSRRSRCHRLGARRPRLRHDARRPGLPHRHRSGIGRPCPRRHELRRSGHHARRIRHRPLQLAHLARLAPGETVLVHGGAGGIGLGVLQYARHCGAKVIATAGIESKRDLLIALGVEHVLDSRTLDFAPRVLELTGGLGVDVVVNSLSSEAIARTLELLRPGGRFVELGKRDMLETQPLPLHPFLHNLSYFGVDVNRLLADPDTLRKLFTETVDRINTGVYRPLSHVVYPAARVKEAFRLLQHSRHTGKVIIRFDPLDEPVPVQPSPARPSLSPGGTYLITGGLGGFGTATADWLADLGARHLALVSRRGSAAPEAATVLDRLALRGVTATPCTADATNENAMRQVIAAVDATGHPLRGVVHSAMQLDDAPFTDLTDERFAPVLATKAAGAAVLHRLTTGHHLDLFLLFSSMATRLGTPLQASYVAGNSYLEALVRARRHTGLPATSIAWGRRRNRLCGPQRPECRIDRAHRTPAHGPRHPLPRGIPRPDRRRRRGRYQRRRLGPRPADAPHPRSTSLRPSRPRPRGPPGRQPRGAPQLAGRNDPRRRRASHRRSPRPPPRNRPAHRPGRTRPGPPTDRVRHRLPHGRRIPGSHPRVLRRPPLTDRTPDQRRNPHPHRPPDPPAPHPPTHRIADTRNGGSRGRLDVVQPCRRAGRGNPWPWRGRGKHVASGPRAADARDGPVRGGGLQPDCGRPR